MIDEKEKTTAPNPFVGANGEQPYQNIDTGIIPENSEKINSIGASDVELDELLKRYEKTCDPNYLHAMTMTELFDRVYEETVPIVEKVLYPGTYLFAGAPKKGKSFFMLQLSYMISTGQPLWGYPVRQGICLYLALEDKFERLQRRLYKMYGANPTDNLYLAVLAKQINEGLEQQIEAFVNEHPETRLVIIDTLQRARGKGAGKSDYSADYEIIVPLKKLADRLNICILFVHHTRKQDAEDIYDTINGTNGLMGAVDGAFVFTRGKGGKTATLDLTGRDVASQRFHLNREEGKPIWVLDHVEDEGWDYEADPILDVVASFMTEERQEWSGTATELVNALGVDMKPNTLAMKLNVNAGQLHSDYRISYKSKRNHTGRFVTLKRILPKA